MSKQPVMFPSDYADLLASLKIGQQPAAQLP